VFNAFSAYTAIMLNILTIYAMRVPKPLKTLLVSLAVSDLGVGLLTQPLSIALMVNPTYSTIVTALFVYASFFIVMAISVVRFLAVHLHLRYQELVAHKRAVVMVISILVLSVFLSLVDLFTFITWLSLLFQAFVSLLPELFIPECISQHAITQTKCKSSKYK